jgi:5'-AMP-activated protein kinase catalytic alpha subunit
MYWCSLQVKAACVAEVRDGRLHMHSRVAIKQLYKMCIDNHVTIDGRRVMEDPWNEISILAQLSDPGHPNVLRFYELLEDDNCIYIILEFLDGGEVFSIVEQHGKVPEDQARHLFSHFVQGTKYIHTRGFAHRDLSLENGMLSSEPTPNTAKLIDFGLATTLPPAGHLKAPEPIRIGKERYMAPETYSMVAYDPVKVDIWTLGMCLFVMCFGIYPYRVASSAHCAYFREIERGNLVTMLTQWNMIHSVSPGAVDLINLILQTDPNKRPAIEEIERHPWLTGAVHP